MFDNDLKYTVYSKKIYETFKKKRYLHFHYSSPEKAIKNFLLSEDIKYDDRWLLLNFKPKVEISANKWDRIKNKKVVLACNDDSKTKEFTIEELFNKYGFKVNVSGKLDEVFHDKDNRKKYIAKASIICKGIFSKSWIKKSVHISIEDDEERKEDFLNGETDSIRIGWYDIWKAVPNARDEEEYKKWTKEIEYCLDKCTKLLGVKGYKITYDGDWDDGAIELELK